MLDVARAAFCFRGDLVFELNDLDMAVQSNASKSLPVSRENARLKHYLTMQYRRHFF